MTISISACGTSKVATVDGFVSLYKWVPLTGEDIKCMSRPAKEAIYVNNETYLKRR